MRSYHRSYVPLRSDVTANFLPGHYDDSDDMQSRVQQIAAAAVDIQTAAAAASAAARRRQTEDTNAYRSRR